VTSWLRCRPTRAGATALRLSESGGRTVGCRRRGRRVPGGHCSDRPRRGHSRTRCSCGRVPAKCRTDWKSPVEAAASPTETVVVLGGFLVQAALVHMQKKQAIWIDKVIDQRAQGQAIANCPFAELVYGKESVIGAVRA